METILQKEELASPLLQETGDAPEEELYLFVCTGNTCRSPMAAALFNHLYGTPTRHAESAGLFADGSPMSENASKALEAAGITPPEHISRPISESLLKKAASVIGITRSHADSLIWAYPEYASKITAMPTDITDPYGGNLAVYQQCLDDIRKALEAQFGRMSQ